MGTRWNVPASRGHVTFLGRNISGRHHASYHALLDTALSAPPFRTSTHTLNVVAILLPKILEEIVTSCLALKKDGDPDPLDLNTNSGNISRIGAEHPADGSLTIIDDVYSPIGIIVAGKLASRPSQLIVSLYSSRHTSYAARLQTEKPPFSPHSITSRIPSSCRSPKPCLSSSLSHS
ncbi:hypothetical protein CC80DRAFT_329764 [Byssothecium circinans]|uniref:Uncharacterized protein n=1 Tax=Byssothecium circinans TaxID=147558 RepID=A0A6A5T8U7_9PLEO|nr:hypothetical protein CC80DRAFT_329764 [Byssothecium circinans]